jgi:hypothetical protein
MKHTGPFLVAMVAALALVRVSISAAQGPPKQTPRPLDPSLEMTVVSLGGGDLAGKLYEPIAKGPKSQIGVLVMPASQDIASACTEMAKRGYTVLCANTGGGGASNIESMLLDVKQAMNYFRKYPGIRKVVLFGHSGGGSMLTAYENIAENGVAACQGPEKLFKCSNRLAGLPAADGLMLGDANWGLAAMTLFSLDPAVTKQDSGQNLNQALNVFNPQNGYNPAGSNYSQEFIHKFQVAQGNRMNLLVQIAQRKLDAAKSGQGDFTDNEPFVAAGADMGIPNNKLFPQDNLLMSHTRNAWPLVHADGSITTQVVHTVRVPQDFGYHTATFGSALDTTVTNFLETMAIRVNDDFGYDEDSVHGIDWSSSFTNPPGNMKGISVPLLTMGMTGHWEYLVAETIYENGKSTDKSIAFIEGANHDYTTCSKCEKTPGQFGDTMKTTYDYADAWLSKPGRF